MDLPLELWQHHIVPAVTTTGRCALRETARLFVPLVQRWDSRAYPLRKRYCNNYKSTRTNLRAELYDLLEAGCVPFLAWITDRHWPVAFLVFYRPTAHDAAFFASLYEQRPACDWQRRYFVAAMRELYWAHVFGAREPQRLADNFNYDFYGICVRGWRSLEDDATRLIYFGRVNVTHCAMACPSLVKTWRHVHPLLRAVYDAAVAQPARPHWPDRRQRHTRTWRHPE